MLVQASHVVQCLLYIFIALEKEKGKSASKMTANFEPITVLKRYINNTRTKIKPFFLDDNLFCLLFKYL